MALLRLIVLDVGWGDSLLIESQDNTGNWHFGLIDCNDTSSNLATLNFFKRRLRTNKIPYDDKTPLFKFVLLTHDHADHGQGLKTMMRQFGSEWFWYPRENRRALQSQLMAYARKSSKIDKQQAVDQTTILPNLGDATMKVLWPPANFMDTDQNNNSVVLLITLGTQSFLLSGDAEQTVWNNIETQIPDTVTFFKVPHHGSRNGSLDTNGNPTWLPHCPQQAVLGISCWARFGHPHQEVIDAFDTAHYSYLRTDLHYHLIAETDGNTPCTVAYHR